MLLTTAAVYAHPAIEYEHAATEIEFPARNHQVAVTFINEQINGENCSEPVPTQVRAPERDWSHVRNGETHDAT